MSDLERQIEEKRKELERLIDERNREITTCSHEWGEIIYDPIVTGGYRIPGDPPGTMGVDWRPSCYVPPKSKKRWKRECKKCGYVEHTERVHKTVRETPNFGR